MTIGRARTSNIAGSIGQLEIGSLISLKYLGQPDVKCSSRLLLPVMRSAEVYPDPRNYPVAKMVDKVINEGCGRLK